MTVPRMGRGPIAGASLEINVPDAVPVANPLGKADTLAMYSKYSSLLAKSGSTVGVSNDAVLLLKSLEDEEEGDASAAALTKLRAKRYGTEDRDMNPWRWM